MATSHHPAVVMYNIIFTLSPEVSRFTSTNNKSQLYHTDIHVQVLITFNDQSAILYTVGEQKRFLSCRKILSIVIMWYWLQCCSVVTL